MEDWDCREEWHRRAGVHTYMCPFCLLRKMARALREAEYGRVEDALEDWGCLQERLRCYPG